MLGPGRRQGGTSPGADPGEPPAPVPATLGGDGILGALVSGDLTEWTRRDAGRLRLAYPAADLSRHAVVVGAAGSGKTETLLRLASLAAGAYGWQVIFLDAKGDTATRDRFVAAMLGAGLPAATIRSFPRQPYDGWRGDARALVNRLMEVTDYSEPYYRELALRVLDLAVSAPPQRPASSADLLGRLTKTALRSAYRNRPEAAEAEEIPDREVAGVANRYRAFFGALRANTSSSRGGARTMLDGSWAFEDAAACYLLLEGLALKAEAARLGRFFLEDFAHYAAARKDRDTPVLLIVDEFSALESTSDAAHLFERLRSFGAAVVISSQGYAGLGQAADRILDAAHTLVLHRCADPERLLSRAGTVSRLEHTRYVDPAGATPVPGRREGTVTRREQWRVKPNDARQLPVGEAVVISGCRAARVRVERVAPDAGLLAAAAEHGSAGGPDRPAAPGFIPAPPPQVPGL